MLIKMYLQISVVISILVVEFHHPEIKQPPQSVRGLGNDTDTRSNKYSTDAFQPTPASTQSHVHSDLLLDASSGPTSAVASRVTPSTGTRSRPRMSTPIPHTRKTSLPLPASHDTELVDSDNGCCDGGRASSHLVNSGLKRQGALLLSSPHPCRGESHRTDEIMESTWRHRCIKTARLSTRDKGSLPVKPVKKKSECIIS
jgi:hypothetical protein